MGSIRGDAPIKKDDGAFRSVDGEDIEDIAGVEKLYRVISLCRREISIFVIRVSLLFANTQVYLR